ncbi:cytochrome b/b6 domain-containing protein [Geminocystis sp. CENA526]|uniref:cytochrome b/b6 domain-containing protein n=1 Tax=Geminocystis sp. CENA526 TaxID=1355871 RepID=UPI003D7003A5
MKKVPKSDQVPTKPYQPLILRIIHNIQGIMIIMAIITAFWTYNTYDGRFGKISLLPPWEEIEGIHGTFGLFTLLIFPIFVVYVIHRGNKKIIQSNTLNQLKLVNKPIWWYSLHRLTNTLIIFALTFAVFTGKMMDENWLPEGELNHFWYYLHLISLILMVFMIGSHLLMNVKIGNYPLILSMLDAQIREKDSYNLWWQNIIFFQQNWLNIVKTQWDELSPHFKLLEITILFIIISAWLISIIK